MSETDFASFMEPVAREFWGEPNKTLSTPKKAVWGSQGARVVDLEKGVWFDHTADEGGGVLDLVMRELPAEKDEALKWLEDAGFIQERRGEKVGRQDHQEPREEDPDEPEAKKVPVKGYRYTDRDGNPLYEVIRFQFKLPDGSWKLKKTGTVEKAFLQRRQVSDGTYVWDLGDLNHTIYRHQAIEMAIAEGKTILLPEGEKDVESLEALGYVASTNSGGAKNWTPALAALFRDADVVIPIDNDDVGRQRGETVALSLRGIARRIRVLDLAPHWPGIGSKEDVSDWIAKAGGTKEKLDAIIALLPDWAPAPPRSAFGAVRMHELHRRDLRHEFLIDEILERQGIAAIAGPSQGGKSFVTVNICGCIAAGLPVWGKEVKQGLVVYQAGEGGKGLSKRLEAWMVQNGIEDREKLPFVLLPKKVNLFVDDKAADSLIAECRAWEAYFGQKLRLLVIDTWNKATRGANEISGQDVGKVLERMERIADECDCLVMFVHHMNQEGSKMRGHTSLLDDLNNLLLVKVLQQTDQNGRPIRTVTIEKNKDSERGKIMRFVLRRMILDPDEEGREVSTCVVDSPAGGEDQVTDDYRLTDQERVVYQALLSALDKFGEVTPYQLRLPASVPVVVKNSHWKDEVRKVWPFADVETDTEEERKAKQDAELTRLMKRHALNLVGAGIIGKDNDLKVVWRTGRKVRGFRRAKVADQPQLGGDVDVPF
ncbi:MAG: AAA family ATPase [Devosia sp.]|nr:AAA family ATPase [Devosia sp.]